MPKRISIFRTLLVPVATWGLFSAVGAPASATGGVGVLLAPAVGAPAAGKNNVTVQCNATVGVATGLNQVSYVVVGTAEAYSTDGTPAIATGVYCVVKDANGRTYGATPPTALPGPAVASVGLINVPLLSDPLLCGYGNALFANNATATGKTLGPC
ncbi:MAG TPA: hypothetical protein VF519_00280 [Mycobacteriales bacterium]